MVDMVDKHGLNNWVELLGMISNHKIWDVLIWGQIFLNTTLSEAFCIANLEAASMGLLVVSTNVGGVCEVLPESMAIYSDCNSVGIIAAMDNAI